MLHNKLYLVVLSLLLILLIIGANLCCITIVQRADGGTTVTVQLRGQSSQPAPEEGNADLWRQQADLSQEETAINTKISGLCSAFAAKDIDSALNYFSEAERDKYRDIFSKYPDIMPKMAADLEKAEISFLSSGNDKNNRMAEYAVQVDGHTFHIVFIKVGGQWMLNTL